MRPAHRWLAGALAGLACVAGSLQAQDSLRISAAFVELPRITVYADILDARANAATGIRPTALKARLGDRVAQVLSISSSTTGNEGIGYIFVVDISRSLHPSQFAEIQSGLSLWIDSMTTRDRAAILTFGETVRSVADFTANKTQLKTAVASLQAADAHTQLYSAIATAMDLERRTDKDLPRRRVVIMLSDGENDAPTGLTREEAVARIQQHRLPLYTIGFAKPGVMTKGLETLAMVARTSGGAYATATGSIADAYATLRRFIKRSSVIQLACEACTADGSAKRLDIQLTSGTVSVSDGIDVRMAGGPSPPKRRIPLWAIIAIVALGLACVGLGAYFVMRRPPEPASQPMSVDTGAPPTVPGKRPTPAPPAGNSPSPAPRPAARGPAVRVQLAITGPGNAGVSRIIDVSQPHVIGRDSKLAETAIPQDMKLSARHCALEVEKGVLIIRDLKSTNGTLVNGVQIHPLHRLEDGDVIRLGDTEIRVMLAKSGAPRGVRA